MAQAPSGDNPLVGAWTLLSNLREVVATGEKSSLFGAHPSGTLLYTADGRMSAIVLADGRKAPAGPAASDAEAVALYRSLVAYAGRYTVETDRVIHHIEDCWNQKWTGTDIVRFYTLERNRLTLKTAPAPNASDGKMSVSTLVWERVS